MRKTIIFLVLITICLLGIKSYAQDVEPVGGLMIFVGPAPHETVKAVAELFIIDPRERKAGLDISTGIVLQGIPNASYGKERIDDLETGEPGDEGGLFDSITPENGVYKVAVVSTGTGRCVVGSVGYDINHSVSSQRLERTTYPGKVDNYEITYSSAPGSQVKVTFTGSSEVPVFDGKGQRPTDVNKFLQYFNPTQARTELPPGTQSFNLMIIYGNTIKRETFSAVLNDNNITSKFNPLPGKLEIVKIPLTQGTNTLILSIKGIRTDGKVAEDADRLVFIVP